MFEKVRQLEVRGKTYQLSFRPKPGWPAGIERARSYALYEVKPDGSFKTVRYFDTLKDAEKFIDQEFKN